eukprot:TRINITY_DN11312_c0_g1_i2.p1 TRINITY_DN11312_c0_g1~~TRINITY_DN11312_c0_g1_i2.p1  ORF type:complete len:234 (+),score=40.86 TRINITY_DN11312_c0_g1_i2:128-829(+)
MAMRGNFPPGWFGNPPAPAASGAESSAEAAGGSEEDATVSERLHAAWIGVQAFAKEYCRCEALGRRKDQCKDGAEEFKKGIRRCSDNTKDTMTTALGFISGAVARASGESSSGSSVAASASQAGSGEQPSASVVGIRQRRVPAPKIDAARMAKYKASLPDPKCKAKRLPTVLEGGSDADASATSSVERAEEAEMTADCGRAGSGEQGSSTSNSDSPPVEGGAHATDTLDLSFQ